MQHSCMYEMLVRLSENNLIEQCLGLWGVCCVCDGIGAGRAANYLQLGEAMKRGN